jgi:hypothetical protein
MTEMAMQPSACMQQCPCGQMVERKKNRNRNRERRSMHATRMRKEQNHAVRRQTEKKRSRHAARCAQLHSWRPVFFKKCGRVGEKMN